MLPDNIEELQVLCTYEYRDANLPYGDNMVKDSDGNYPVTIKQLKDSGISDKGDNFIWKKAFFIIKDSSGSTEMVVVALSPQGHPVSVEDGGQDKELLNSIKSDYLSSTRTLPSAVKAMNNSYVVGFPFKSGQNGMKEAISLARGSQSSEVFDLSEFLKHQKSKTQSDYRILSKDGKKLLFVDGEVDEEDTRKYAEAIELLQSPISSIDRFLQT